MWELLALLGALTAVWLWFSYSRVPWLDQFSGEGAWPRVTVLLAARDEERALPACLASLAALDYPELEVLVVDDRSRDSTPRILAESHVRSLRVDELPPGWLGKTHALWRGAQEATGDYFLFTDADVVMAPDTVRRAMAAALLLRADHLVGAPDLRPQGFWEQIFISHFATMYGMRFQPAWVSRPGKYPHAGVGAFSLMRAGVYRACGGFERLRLNVLEDTDLGWLVKQNGYRQAFVGAARHVRVRWLEGLPGIVRGLEKNLYAGFQFSLVRTGAAVAASLLAAATPFALVAQGRLHEALALWLFVSFCSARFSPIFGAAGWGGLFFPLGSLLAAYAMIRSAWVTERQGGVRWRETFYPLAELRAYLRSANRASISEAPPRKTSS